MKQCAPGTECSICYPKSVTTLGCVCGGIETTQVMGFSIKDLGKVRAFLNSRMLSVDDLEHLTTNTGKLTARVNELEDHRVSQNERIRHLETQMDTNMAATAKMRFAFAKGAEAV